MRDDEWVVVHAGCAECAHEPLIEFGGVYPSMDAAKANVDPEGKYPWKPHPEGGVIHQFSDGATWIAPVSALREEA